MIWLLLAPFAVVIIADVVLRIPIIKGIVPVLEKMPLFGVVQAAADPHGEQQTFSTTNGLKLKGSLLRPDSTTEPAGVVVFFPELAGNHWMARQYTEALLKAGMAVFAFDFRNQGESECMPGYEPLHWLTQYEIDDGLAAIHHVRSMPEFAELPLGLFGVSRGGSAALAVGGQRKDVAWIACDSAFTTNTMTRYFAQRWAELYAPKLLLKLVPQWHVNSTISIARFFSERRRGCRYRNPESTFGRLKTCPILMISGKRDSYVKPVIAEQIQAQLGENCQLWVVSKAKHNMARQTATAEYDNRLLEFVSSAVPTLSLDVPATKETVVAQ